MCMAVGAPKKPEYGPCQERHGGGGISGIGGTSNNYTVAYGNYTANDTTTGGSNYYWANINATI